MRGAVFFFFLLCVLVVEAITVMQGQPLKASLSWLIVRAG